MRNIDRLARQALAGGNLDGAEKLIGEALRQDPNDSEALSLKGAGEAQAGRRGGRARWRRPIAARPSSSKPAPQAPRLRRTLRAI